MPDGVAAVAAREWGPWGAGVGRGCARRASRTGGSWDARHVRTAASLANGRPFQFRRTAASLRRYDAATWRARASAPLTEAGTCGGGRYFPNRAHGWREARRGGAAVARWYGVIAFGADACVSAGSAFVCCGRQLLEEQVRRRASLGAHGAPGDLRVVVGRRGAEITSNGAPSRRRLPMRLIFADAAARLQDALP